jgi:hypothetical protein
MANLRPWAIALVLLHLPVRQLKSSSMRRTRLLASVFVLSLCVISSSAVRAQLPTARPEFWREDLQTLAATLTRFHPDAFSRTPPAEFNASVSGLNQAIPSLSEAEIIVGLARIAALAADAHTRLFLASAQTGFRTYPMRFQWFGDGLFVTQTIPDLRQALGKRLIAIGSLGIEQALQAIAPAISYENRPWLERVGASYLVIPEVLFAAGILSEPGPAVFRFDDESGGAVELTIAPVQRAPLEWLSAPDPEQVPLPLYRREPSMAYWFRYLSASRTVYLKYNICETTDTLPFSQVTSQILNLVDTLPFDRVVIDLRENGGGSSSVLVPLLAGLEQRAAAGRLNLRTQLVGLINAGTFSAAMDNATLIRALGGRLAGQPTGGKPNSFGDVQYLTLPRSRLLVQYSTRSFRRSSEDLPFVAPDSLVELRSTDYFVGRDPVLDAVLEGALPGTAMTPLSIHRGGGLVLDAPGTNSSAVVGYAAAFTNLGATPHALAFFRNRVRGVTISEAPVAAQALTTSARIFLEKDARVRTGIAIVNPSSAPVAISFRFTDQTGRDSAPGNLALAPGEQMSRFVDELLDGLPAEFLGTLTIEASAPVGVTAMRGTLNERLDFLLTTLPVFVPGTDPGTDSMLAHFADGGEWSTEIVAVNTTDDPESGTIRFVSSSGQELSAHSYTVAPRSVLRVRPSGTTAAVRTGSVKLQVDSGSRAPGLSAIVRVRTNGIIVAEGAIPAIRPATSFRMYAESAGAWTNGEAGALMTGVAVANPGSEPATAEVNLSNLSGSLIGRSAISIPSGAQLSVFLTQLPGFQSLSTPQRGVLAVTSVRALAVTAIRARLNERRDFLFAGTPPVDETSTGSTVYIPHLASGGGYSTQLVFVESSLTAPSNGMLRFFDTRGQPLALDLR